MGCSKCKKARLARKQASLTAQSSGDTVLAQFLEDTTLEYESGDIKTYKAGDYAVLSFGVFDALVDYCGDCVSRRA